MNLFSRAGRIKETVKSVGVARLIGVLAGGSLGQRVVATLGLAVIGFGIYQSLIWVVLVFCGWLLCVFAVQDYERTQDP